MDKAVNKRIASARRMRGVSQQELAARLGLKSSTYSQRERTGKIDIEFLKKISTELNVDINFLMYGENPFSEKPKAETEPQPMSKPEPEPAVKPQPPALELSHREIEYITLLRNLPAKKREYVFRFAYKLFKKKMKFLK